MKRIFTLLISLMLIHVANAQTTVSFPSSSPYTQDFNTTPGAAGQEYPTGWRAYNNTTFDGSMTVGSQSSTTGANYNYVNRIGVLGSSGAFDPSSIVLAISSTTGATNMKITYNVVKIREQGRSMSFNLEVSTTSPTSGFSAVTGGEYASGTIAENTSTAYTNIDISTLDNNSGPVYIRWSYANISGSGSRDGLALDDVSVSWDGALPISLLSFTAQKLSEKVKVQWTTATEINNDKFIVERSADGKEFDFVTEVKGAGNSKEINKYEIVDESPLKGTSYYRLTQIDYDGRSETFAPVAVKMDAKSMEVIANSSELGTINLNVFSPSAGEGTLVIRDLSGRTIVSEKIILTEGYQNFNINSHNLQGGIHLIQLVNGAEVVVKKLIL